MTKMLFLLFLDANHLVIPQLRSVGFPDFTKQVNMKLL